jgi:hypothetical protein
MTLPTLQVSVWLSELPDFFGHRPVSCAVDLFDGGGVVDPKLQMAGRRRPPSLTLTRRTRSSSRSGG